MSPTCRCAERPSTLGCRADRKKVYFYKFCIVSWVKKAFLQIILEVKNVKKIE